MDNSKILNEFNSYEYLVNKFSADEISSRYNWVNNLLADYIDKKGYRDRVIISEDILKHVIIDYFVDIDRLKEFQDIESLHISKIYAYLSFWLLRHKVLQITTSTEAPDLTFVNEEFVCYFIRSYLFSEPENVAILDNKKECVDNFIDTLLYHFQYRDYSAKNIELIILAFQAGCGYQYSADYPR